MVVPVWAEPLARCYSTIMVLLPTRRIFDFSTSYAFVAVDIATSGRLSDMYVLITFTFELIFICLGGKMAAPAHQRRIYVVEKLCNDE